MHKMLEVKLREAALSLDRHDKEMFKINDSSHSERNFSLYGVGQGDHENSLQDDNGGSSHVGTKVKTELID